MRSVGGLFFTLLVTAPGLRLTELPANSCKYERMQHNCVEYFTDSFVCSGSSMVEGLCVDIIVEQLSLNFIKQLLIAFYHLMMARGYTHARTRTHTRAHTYTHAHTRIHTYTHTRTRTRTRTHTHTHTHMHMHTHAHTHKHKM